MNSSGMGKPVTETVGWAGSPAHAAWKIVRMAAWANELPILPLPLETQ